MERRCVRDDNSHKLGPYILPKLCGIVIQEYAALPEKSLTRPVVQPQQFKRPSTRKDPRCVCTNDKTLQNAASLALGVTRKQLRNRLGYFHSHIIMLHQIILLTRLKSPRACLKIKTQRSWQSSLT
jgi:hypothetical protein